MPHTHTQTHTHTHTYTHTHKHTHTYIYKNVNPKSRQRKLKSSFIKTLFESKNVKNTFHCLQQLVHCLCVNQLYRKKKQTNKKKFKLTHIFPLVIVIVYVSKLL